MTEANGPPVVEKVQKWLMSQGYPLEMAVGAKFRSRGFSVFQSDYYRDPDTDKEREIDVLAYLQTQIDSSLFRLSCCVECKVSHDKPWVLLSSKDHRLAAPALVAQRAATPLGADFLMQVCRKPAVYGLDLFRLCSPASFGVAQAFSTGTDAAFAACMSAAKAAADKARSHRRGGRKLQVVEILLPVVVVDGVLMTAELDDKAEIIAHETSCGTLLWRNPVLGYPFTLVHVITVSGLPEFLGWVERAWDRLSKEFVSFMKTKSTHDAERPPGKPLA